MQKKKFIYNVPNNAKFIGKKINKRKQVQSKIFKNLSQFPIEVQLEGKENHSISSINRPHSSLTQEHTHKNLRMESALSFYPDNQNKKRLSLDSTNKKHERDSLISRHSMSKKTSKNHIVIDQTTKLKLAQDRRRQNNSCSSAIQQKSKGDNRKKMSQKPKRLSVNNIHPLRKEGTDKVANTKVKEERSLIIRDKTDKSKSKSKNTKKRKKSVNQLQKYKASTTAIGFIPKNEKIFLKKKQSSSTAAILPPQKEKRKKVSKKAQQKIQIIDQFSQSEYPINKYELIMGEKRIKNILKPKSKSRSRKGSNSKDKQKNKRSFSLIEEIDYSSCINIPSNSSDLISSLSQSEENTSKIKIIDNWEFRYFGEENPTSVNLQQIRYYQSFSCKKQQKQRDFVKEKFNNRRYKKRQQIQNEISEYYPSFNQLQIKFLASIIFIQRKWRQRKLYRQIFKNFTSGNNSEYLMNIFQKSNSKQLNISNNGPKSAEKASKNVTQVDSANLPSQADTYVNSHSNNKEAQYKKSFQTSNMEFKEETLPNQNTVEKLNNEAYFFQNSHSSIKPEYQKERQKVSNIQFQQSRKSISSDNLGAKSLRYQFLESQIFPNITYIVLKKQQLKAELISKINKINHLLLNEIIRSEQHQKLKRQYQQDYQKKLKQLSKSKQDIKKGYLKFIDAYKDIRHEALRKVSSQTGLMANMYKRIFHFDQHISTPSESSQSLKKITKKILIRKQFYFTQKIQPFIQNRSLLLQKNQLTERISSNNQQLIIQQQDLSARCFRSRKQKNIVENSGPKRKEMFLDIDSLSSDRMESRRIRQGYIISPAIQKDAFSKDNVILQFNKSDQLLPLTIISPKYEGQTNDFPQNYQRKQRLVLEQIIATLTHQLYTELVKIDEKRDKLVNDHELLHIRNIDMIQQGQSYEQDREQKSDEFQIIEEEKFREIYKIQGLQDRNQDGSFRKHRNSNQYNISPAVSQKIAFDSDDILFYAKSLFQYLEKSQYLPEIIERLNKNQGFTPLEYLKFLRDFQIPDEQYDPLISNQAFIQWEDYFYNKYYPKNENQTQESFIKKQSITIFHRCIFQSIIFAIQQHRPCGQKGIPFPWENVMYFHHTLELKDTLKIFSFTSKKLQDLLRINCGIIDEKYIIYHEEDLQKIHEDNEDRIINMLEKELSKSPHNWYQVEQHCLQIKLELEGEIIQYLILQALDELLDNC